MDGTKSQQEEKPFSVLEKFRQLKKVKEQVPAISKEPEKLQETSGTVFQALGSSSVQSSEELGIGSSRCGRGRFGRGRGKRRHDNFSERPLKRTATDFNRGQKEQDVGITEFIRSGPGFDVILKHRYSDFHVHEIDLEGNVVMLTSTEIPIETEETVSTEEDPTVLSPEQWTALAEIVDKQVSGTVDKDVTDLNKAERQRIHRAVKRRFGVHVFSNTNTLDGRKTMQIGYATGQKNHRFCRWPQGRPEYLHFVLYKENCDMTEAVSIISKHTGIKANKFGYAGNKDKRAVTSQQMCARRAEVERFNSCNGLRGIVVGNYCYKESNLRLGDLRGNRFKLVLRNVKASDEVVEEAIESFKKTGFINYFGMQRFGQSALVPTYVVGQAILKGDWKLAAELVLKPRPGEATYWDIKEAREIWWEKRDASAALKPLFRKDKSIEGKLLMALKKHGPNAYQNAFDSIPHHTVTLYLHSYQSLVWNKVVSRRVREFGLRVLPGDLVQTNASGDADQLAYRMQDDQYSDNSEDENEEAGKEGCKIQVKVLSAEEAEIASIHDVVYPLPGDDIRFPNNEIAQWYTEILEADGNSLDYFRTVNKKYGMYGTYRKMLETVDNFKWSTQRYSDPDEDLLLSDLDILMKKPAPALAPDGPYKALVIEFDLKVCCYATMAIREFTKCETSVANQSKLTQEAREEDLAAKKLKREETQSMKIKSKDNRTDNSETSSNGMEVEKSEAEKGSNEKTNTIKMEVESEDIMNNIKVEGKSDDEKGTDSINPSDEVNCKRNLDLEDSDTHKQKCEQESNS